MRYINSYWSSLVVLLLVASSGFSQSVTEVGDLTLSPGKSISRNLAAGEVHSYRLQLTANHFVSLTVEQQGIDVLVTLYDADGKRIARADSLSYFKVAAPVPVTIVTNVGGNYRLEIRSLKANVSPGSYDVTVNELRVATPQDVLRASARQAFAEGWHLHSRDWAEPMKARQRFEEALAGFRSAGDERGAAQSLTELGWIQTLQGQQLPKAIEYYNGALPLFRVNKDLSGEALALCGIGWAYYYQGDPEKAFDYNQRAVDLYRKAGDRRGEAFALNRLGRLYAAKFQMLAAREVYEQARVLFRLVGDRRGEGRTHYLVGTTYEWSGEKQQALDTYWQARSLLQSAGDPLGEALTLYNIAEVYRSWGELQKAVDYYAQSFAIQDKAERESGRPFSNPRCDKQIGDLYAEMGDRRKALACYSQILSTYRSMNESDKPYGIKIEQADLFTAVALQSMALNEPQKGRESLHEAVDYLLQQIPHWKVVGGEWEAAALSRIGTAYFYLSDYRKALDYFLKSLTLYQARNHRHAQTFLLKGIGETYTNLGELALAIDYYNQELQLRRATSEHAGEARALYDIARIERRRNNLKAAREQIEAAVRIIESLRTQIANQQSRTSYFSEVQRYYEFYISQLMQLHAHNPSEGYDAMAFQASEQARARLLLEALNEARADIRQGVDFELLKREREVGRRVNAAAEKETRLLAEKPNDPGLAAIRNEIDAATSELQQIEEQIRVRSPRYSALTKPRPLMLNQIQKDVLDGETALLEYSLGQEQSYLFLVTQTSIRTFELQKRSELEDSVRHAVALLGDGERSTTRGRLLSAESQQVISSLSRVLLPPALMSQLNVKRLVIVGDGPLQYLPFSALSSPKLQSRPLIADYELVSLPSASTLAVLRRETSNRQPATASVAVLADPVFDDTDERVKAAVKKNKLTKSTSAASANPDATLQQQSTFLERALRLDTEPTSPSRQTSFRIRRLPFTRFEAEGISSLARAENSLKAIDFRANRETATSPEMAQYRFIHFATHGLLNSSHPELSGIVLSLFDPQGKPIDGFLRLHDIYNLNLPADLVVLSACQTGLGKEIRGEGLIGLTRGFMYAGAPRVVASLWKVDDAATAELMKRFYAAMLKDNLRPAAALRRAKIEMWKQKRWEAPFYWAAFELQGEWR